MQKGFAPVLVLVGILVLAAVTAGAYYFLKENSPTVYFGKSQVSKPQPPIPVVTSPTPQATPTPSSTPDETANWKIYNSGDGNFSFKYPEDWIYETRKWDRRIGGKEYNNAVYLEFGRPLSEEQRKLQGYINFDDTPKTFRNMTLYYVTSPDSQKILDILSTDKDQKRTIQIDNGIIAKEFKYECQYYCIGIVFRKDDTVYNFDTGPNADSDIQALRQILSTFRFD